jgi:hypothetical protein
LNFHTNPTSAAEIAFLSPLWRGITTPSLAALAVAALVMAAMVVGALVLITPARIHGDRAGLLAGTPLDDFAFATARANALASSERTDTALVILGGSGVREAYESPVEVARIASAESGYALEGVGLAAHGQILWETLMLADSIPRDRPALVLIHVSPYLLAASVKELEGLVEHPRVGRRSEMFDSEARRQGVRPQIRFGNHFLDNLDYYLLRIPIAVRHLTTGTRPDFVLHRYLEGNRSTRQMWRQTAPRVLDRWSHYDARVDANYAVLLRMMETLARHGNKRIAFVESPLNPAFLVNFVQPDFYRGYVARMQAFARCTGVPYWLPQRVVGLEPDVFYDWAHLNASAAQARMARELAGRVADELSRPASTTLAERCIRASAQEASG